MAWKEFFIKEQSLRDKMRLSGPEKTVKGQLTFANNVDLTITHRTLASGIPIVDSFAFNCDDWLEYCFAECPWLSFALRYILSMKGRSRVLDWESPTFSVDLFPFSRPFYTKEESKVDFILLNKAYQAQLDMLPGPSTGPSLVAYHQESTSIGTRIGDGQSLQHEDLVQMLDSPQNGLSVANISLISDTSIRPSIGAARKQLSPDEATFITADSNPLLPPTSSNSYLAGDGKNTMFVGGTAVHNTAMVVGSETNKFADLPVSIHALPVPLAEGAILLSSKPTEADINTPKKPTLLLPAKFQPGVEVSHPLGADTLLDVIKQSDRALLPTLVPQYVLKGEIHNVLGVPGLGGHLYLFSSQDDALHIKEKVKIDLDGDSPLTRLFPHIGQALTRSIPISNIEFVYSDSHSLLGHAAGLRLEADIEFRGPLEPVSELLDVLFGATGNTAPDALHISAHLSRTRNWSAAPSFSSLILQGSFENMSFWIKDFLEIKTIGAEVSFGNVVNLTGKETSWSRGYGLFGELDIHKIPGTATPLRVAYKMTKSSNNYQLLMRLTSDDWVDVFGIKGLDVSSIRGRLSYL